jgi:carboxylate-amine ligase
MPSDQAIPLTLGVEEEFQLLCPETLALVPAYDRLVARNPQEDFNIKSEIHQSCCEVVTRPCRTVGVLDEELRSNRRCLIEIAERAGICVALSGTHPFSHWADLEITREKRRLFSEHLFQEAHRQCLAFALHIHIGVPDRGLALRVMNDARRLLPILYALSCSSPFLEERQTGLKSSRLLRAFGFPRTGIPDTFENLDQLDQLVATMQQAGLILDEGQLWWDIRVHHLYPTVEFRVCDAVPLLQDVTALAALTQTFVARLLEDYANGNRIEPLDRFLVSENRWRAARFGTDVQLLDHDTLSLVPLAEQLANLCAELEHWARRLHVIEHIERVLEVAAQGSAADRQLAVWKDNKTALKEVVGLYLAETSDF